MELGIYTFGDITPDPNTGRTISIRQRYAEILAAAKLADQAGLDVFGVGEHHRLDIPISSPAAIMAAIAGTTKRIRLTSAVTILSTLDPVRVFQDFATVDLLSGGRAEVIAGRGAFIESFALFGDDIADYDALFAEKLDLLLKLNEGERVTWRGRFRAPLKVAIATHVHVAKDSQTAFKEFYPHYSAYFREHAPRADLMGEISRDVYEKRAGAAGPILVGSPQQIIDKLIYERELFAHDRFLGQVDIGGLPYAKVAKSIELLATQVLPVMRRPTPAGVDQGC
jgi:alkanesulfonate monooxygenase SsuD/methylene tetrahydromethanopterin reductase-like flavin-dependent oxidoreductase (luciferase family)